MRENLKRLGPYLDDILLAAGGVCFTAAGGLFAGAALALTVAGGWLTLLAVLVAKGKGAGDDAATSSDSG